MLRIPGHIHTTAAPNGGSVVLDRRTGRCYALNGLADQLWRAWHTTGDYDTALTLVAATTTVGPRFPTQSRELADTLVATGLLATDEPHQHPRANAPDTTTTSPAVPDESAMPGAPAGPVLGQPVSGSTPTTLAGPDSAVPGFRVAALLAVPLTLLVVLLPFRVMVSLLTWSRQHWCRRTASGPQTEAALAAISRATRYHPGRIACLELSLGTVVTLALGRRHAPLVIGVAHAPCRFHAWVGSPEGPVHDRRGWTPEFRPIVTL